MQFWNNRRQQQKGKMDVDHLEDVSNTGRENESYQPWMDVN